MALPDPIPSEQSAAPVRKRYTARKKSRWERIPIAVRIGLPLVLVALGWFGYQQWRVSHAVLRFRFGGGGEVPPLTLTVFPDQWAFHAPSPPAPLGELRIEGDEVVLSRELVDGTAFVRFEGPGIGTGFARVEVGAEPRAVLLGPPTSMTGRVSVPEGILAFGLRATGSQPVAGARVIGLGGGEHGVVLCEAVSDAAGDFALEGFDAELPMLGVRVLAKGYGVAFENWWSGQTGLTVSLVATRPIAGRVLLPEGVQGEGLRVLAKGLPGVETAVGPEGRFWLDHVPPNFTPRLLVYGLPAGFTHRLRHGAPGQAGIDIEVLKASRVEGWVLDRMTQRPLGGAIVWHDHGPTGRAIVEAAADGSFVLELVPPGKIRLSGQYNRALPGGEEEVLTGQSWIEIEVGVDLKKVAIRVD